MKTFTLVSMLLATSALAFTSYRYGYLDEFQGSVIPYLQKKNILEKDPRHIVIGLDITAGREGELEKDRAAIARMISETRLGDKVELYLIHSRSESDQEAAFTAEMPAEPGPAGQVLARAKQKAEKEWSDCWVNQIVPLMASGRKQSTDLLGFMRYVTRQKPEFQEHPHPMLVLFTDGMHVGDGFNMEKSVPAPSQLSAFGKEDLIPDLKGISIRFAGVTPTHNVSNAHWRKIQAFWTDYAHVGGAENVIVTSDRNVRLN